MKKFKFNFVLGRMYPNATKILMVMKLTFFLILFSMFSVLASETYSQSKKLTLDMKEATVQDVLSLIEEQSEFYFLYSEKVIDVYRKVSVDVENQNVELVLNKLFAGTNVIYSIKDRIIVLSTPEVLREGTQDASQQSSVSGKVTDNRNAPLPGVTVVVKGTTQGVITDASGDYTLTNVPANAVLQFSFVGMHTQEVVVGSQTRIDVKLEEEAIGLEEVVAIGYGTQKKASVTGSIASTDDEMIKRSPAISVSNSLSGLLPGLTTLNRTGQPGENTSEIYIRGRSTTGDTSPLVVIDGVPDETGAWQRISQNDIEQISVLKDASAAIYGARAANGVIIITTKRGSIGKPVFDYSYNQGIVQPTRLPEMANSWEWAEYVNQYRVEMQKLPPQFTDSEIQTMKDGTDPVNYGNNDWIGAIFKDFSLQSKHNLSIRGGAENVRYSLSGSYSHENSMVKNGLHEYTGYTLRSNVDVQVTENVKFGLDINGGIDDVIQPLLGDFGYDSSPLIPPFYPNGFPASLPGDNGENPAINLTGEGGYYSNKIFRGSFKSFFDVIIPKVKGLAVDGYFSFRNEFTENKRWRDTWTVYNYNSSKDEYISKKGGIVSKPDLRERFNKDKNYLVNLRVKYDKTFGDHVFQSFVAVEQSEGSYRFLEAYRKDFISPAIEELFAGSSENMVANGLSRENARQNIFGRISYNFQEKYLADINLRYDGSYRFPKGNRWGFFPGVSAGWRLSEEEFLKNSETIDNLKLRMSYGQMGNDQVAAFQFLSMYNLDPTGTHFGGGTQGKLLSGVAPNTNITWEVAENSNIGLDASLWEGALGFTFDAFKQRRSNILTARTAEVPNYTGLVLPDENVGIIENKGFELSVSHRNKVMSPDQISYSVTGNVAFVRNKVVDVSEPQDMPEYQKAEGGVIGAGLYFDAIGIFRTQQEVDANAVYPGTRVGDLQYRDIDKNGVINGADRIRVNKGPIPEVTFGLNTTLGYKNFSLFANFTGQTRAWTYIHRFSRTTTNSLRDLIVNRYTPGSMDSKYPIIPQEDEVGEGEVSGMASTFWLQDATFLRLKTMQLGYTIPGNMVTKLGLSSVMLYFNGNNLFTLAKIKWFDPEGSPEMDNADGIDYSTGNFYPQTKIYNIGINITF